MNSRLCFQNNMLDVVKKDENKGLNDAWPLDHLCCLFGSLIIFLIFIKKLYENKILLQITFDYFVDNTTILMGLFI